MMFLHVFAMLVDPGEYSNLHLPSSTDSWEPWPGHSLKKCVLTPLNKSMALAPDCSMATLAFLKKLLEMMRFQCRWWCTWQRSLWLLVVLCLKRTMTRWNEHHPNDSPRVVQPKIPSSNGQSEAAEISSQGAVSQATHGSWCREMFGVNRG